MAIALSAKQWSTQKVHNACMHCMTKDTRQTFNSISIILAAVELCLSEGIICGN